jgi:hypothetical protein
MTTSGTLLSIVETHTDGFKAGFVPRPLLEVVRVRCKFWLAGTTNRIEVVFLFDKNVDVGIGKCSVTTKEPAAIRIAITGPAWR